MSTQSGSMTSPAANPPKPASQAWKFGLVLLIVVALAAAGIWWGQGHHAKATPSGESGSAASSSEGDAGIRVDVVHPQKGGLTRTSTQVGTVHPFQDADLYAKVSGYLKWQEVDIGSPVKKGDLLAVIDDPEVLKEADRAAAALKQAKAMVGQAKARIEAAQASVKAAEADVSRAEKDVASFIATRHYREKELKRYRDLRAREAVPQQVVDEYEDHYETAVARESAAEAAVNSAKAERDAAKAKVDQARADLAEAESNVEVTAEVLAKAKVLVDYTRITSPYDGVVTLRNFFAGDFIRSATEGSEGPMLTVARTDKMRVVTFVPDLDVPYTDVGDKAIITLDALPGRKFEGKVSRFSYSEAKESRTMRTEVDLENPDHLLREGMYGIATIVLESNTSNLTVPSGCLTGKAQEGKSSVFVVKDGKAHEVPVSIGTDNGIRVEILKGLSADDQVITNKGAVGEDTPVIVQGAEKVAAAG